MNQKSKIKKYQTQTEQYNIIVTGRNVQVTEAMKDYAIDKVMKMDRFVNKVLDVNIIMDIQKLDHKVDIIMRLSHFKVKVQGSSDNMYSSVDKAVVRLQSRLKKYKDKIKAHQAKSTGDVDMNVHVFRRPQKDDLEEFNSSIEEANLQEMEEKYRPHEIVKKETRPLKTLTYDEAVMKMELSEDVFLIFINEEDQKIKVIYRRKDDNYGVIEAEK